MFRISSWFAPKGFEKMHPKFNYRLPAKLLSPAFHWSMAWVECIKVNSKFNSNLKILVIIKRNRTSPMKVVIGFSGIKL